MKLTDADNAADGIFFPALEQNMMGAVLINENDEVMFFNPAAEKLWGYKREEVIGNNIDMLIPRDLRPAHPEYIRHNRECVATSHLTGINAGVRSPGNCRSPDPLSDAGTIE